MSRFFLTRAIVEDYKFEINSFYNQTGDRANYKDEYYSDKTPGLSFLATPVYTLYRFLYNQFVSNVVTQRNLESTPLNYYSKGISFTYDSNPGNFILSSMFLITVFTSSLFSAMTVLLIYKISEYLIDDEKQRILIVIIYGLGTLAFIHSIVFTSHSIEAFLGFLSFYLLLKSKKYERKKETIFLAGIVLGLGIVVSRFVLFIFIPCLLYVIFINKRMVLIFLIGFAIGILPLLIYYQIIFGGPFLWIVGGLKYIDTISSPTYLDKIYSDYTGNEIIPLSYLKTNLIPIILQILVFPSKGLFLYYPILVFSFVGLFYSYKKYKLESTIILFLFSLCLIMTASGIPVWWGGFSGFGIRYMLPTIPFLMIPLMILLEKIDSKIIIIALSISVFFNFLMLQYGEDAICLLDASTYEQKLKNFEVLSNPLVDHYLSLFLRNGPRSILFENILLNKKIDIRLTPHSCGLTPPILQKSEVLLFTLPFIGIIALKLPFLSLVPIFLVIFLIWKKEILKKLNLSSKQKLLILIGSIFIFIVLFIRITNFLYGENWYAPEWYNGKIDTGRWMNQNSTIQIFNGGQKVTKKTLNFHIEPFNKTRPLQIYLNDELVFEDIIKNETWIKKQFTLLSGLNEIKFVSVEGCEIPTELGIRDCDLRCLSFKIESIQ